MPKKWVVLRNPSQNYLNYATIITKNTHLAMERARLPYFCMKKIYLYRNGKTDAWIIQDNIIPSRKLGDHFVLCDQLLVSQRALDELERSPLVSREGPDQYKGDWVIAILAGLSGLDNVATSVNKNLGTDLELDFPWSHVGGIEDLFKLGNIYSEFDILAAVTQWYREHEFDPMIRTYNILSYYQLAKVNWNGIPCYQVIDVIK